LKEIFITRFIASFLAAWCVKEYEDVCMSGNFEKMTKSQPVEDAEHLAECAWQQCKEHLGRTRQAIWPKAKSREVDRLETALTAMRKRAEKAEAISKHRLKWLR